MIHDNLAYLSGYIFTNIVPNQFRMICKGIIQITLITCVF